MNRDEGPRSFPSVRPKEVWEQVLDELRTRIVLGELPPGERLVETELARQFGVSRGPVRTALLTMEQSGLVTSSTRRGVEVASFSLDDIDELFAVRTALEALAAQQAAGRCTPDVIARLEQHLDELEMYRAEGRPFEAVEADLAFHRDICEISGNGRLATAWGNLADQLEVVMASVHRIDPAVAANDGEHREIVAALAAKDPDASEAALRRHLLHSCSTFKSRTDAASPTLAS
ncbi:MAG: GntR family transcriptional regulator [Ilumatobacteraceae bacterium]